MDVEECVEVNRAAFEEAELISRVAEINKETGSKISNFSKKGETTPQVVDKEEKGHINSEKRGLTASMERIEEAQDCN
ncbi:hypothetical protein U1Q18_018221 [Sarracenia purpurea var. burkii]